MNDLKNIIQEYIRRGWYLFPVDGKYEYSDWKRGEATQEVDRLVEWFEDHPESNLAIATGQVSNLVVIDIDDDTPPDHFSRTYTVQTNGGYHLYYRWREPTLSVPYRDYIDIRGDKKYVVCPPSPGYTVYRDMEVSEPDEELTEHLRWWYQNFVLG